MVAPASDSLLMGERPVLRNRDRNSLLTGSLEPGLFGDEQLFERLLRRVTQSRAVLEVRQIGYPAIVFVTKEEVDVVPPAQRQTAAW